MKNFDIGLVRRKFTWHPGSWLSAAVRFFTGSRYNHSFLFYTIGRVDCVIEATERGVYITPFQEWQKKYPHELRVIRLTKYTGDPKKLVSSFGKYYDYTSLFRHQVVHQIQRWFGVKKWKGRTGEKAAEKLYCSELVAYVFNVPEWWRFTTADLAELEYENVEFFT